jgi:hypothetical protein|tara:strand:+ start:50 stop:523 length:474 start_codon:yes stop_codon:yes gene_type:complete
MSYLDLANNILSTQLYTPQSNTQSGTTVNTAELDLQGKDGAMIIVVVGEHGGTTSGSLKHHFVLQHSDASGSGFTDVTSASDVSYGSVTSAGIFATINAPATEEQNYQIGYAGVKRYVRVGMVATGNHSAGIPIGVNAITSDIHKPEYGSDDGSPTG